MSLRSPPQAGHEHDKNLGEKLKKKGNRGDDYSEPALVPPLKRNNPAPATEPIVSKIEPDGTVSWRAAASSQKVKRWAIRFHDQTDGWGAMKVVHGNVRETLTPAGTTVVAVAVVDPHNQVGPWGVSQP